MTSIWKIRTTAPLEYTICQIKNMDVYKYTRSCQPAKKLPSYLNVYALILKYVVFCPYIDSLDKINKSLNYFLKTFSQL